MATDYSQWLLGLLDQTFCTQLLDTIYHYEKSAEGEWVAKAIPRCFATPDRAFSQMAKVLGKFLGTTVDVARIPLPFSSLSRLGIERDPTRSQISPVRASALIDSYGEYHSDEDDIQSWLDGTLDASLVSSSLHPVAVKVNYQVDYWARNLRHLDKVSEQLFQAFYYGVFTITIPFPEPFGDKMVSVEMADWGDNSDLEGDESSNRRLRKTVGFTVSTWIPMAASSTKLVQEIDIDAYHSDDLVTEDYLLKAVKVTSEGVS